jgi:hypothetical protein
MAALFIHVNWTLTSWCVPPQRTALPHLIRGLRDYFWATLAVYGLAWLSRVARTIYTTGFGLLATVESVGPDLIKLSIRVPKSFKWAPGQHVFVRILGLGVHALTSHPFTISSLHTSGAETENTAELVMRVHRGLTGALARRVTGKAAWTSRVVLDGPYGGLHVPLKAYERVYLLAGGSGAYRSSFVCRLRSDSAPQARLSRFPSSPTSLHRSRPAAPCASTSSLSLLSLMTVCCVYPAS